MKRKEIVSILFAGAAAMALNAAPTWAQSQGGKDSSVGGSQSERVGPGTDTPVPKGSRSAGSTDASKAGKGPGSGSAQGKGSSAGGTKRDRVGSETDTPLPKGSRSAGSTDAGKAGKGPGSASQSQATGGQQNIRQVQEALKDQGHDPGPIDGVMGSQTSQALKEFQKANGLKQTGSLDAETKQKLKIEGSSAGSGSSMGSGSTGKGESPRGQKEPSSPMGK